MSILQIINPKRNTLISVLFAAFLITSVNIDGGMGVSALLMLIVSIFGLYATRKQNYHPLQAWEKYWIASLFFFVGIIYIDVIKGYSFLSAIDSQSRLLLAIPVYLYVRRVGVNINTVFLGIALSGAVTGYYAFIETSLGSPRIDGFTNAVYYGGITTAMFLLCIVSTSIVKNNLMRLFLVLASICTLYATLLSGARGAWLALPVMFCVYLIYNIWNLSLLKRMLLVLFFSVALVVVYQSPQLGVKDRVETTATNISEYINMGKMSSVGFRLEMWKASWLIAKSDNFLGNGPDDYKLSVSKIIESGQSDKSISVFAGPHNQYMESLINQGALGLISLLSVLLVPTSITIKKLRAKKGDKIYEALVLSILVPYMVFMVSVSALEIQIMSLFFAFTVSMFLGFFSYKNISI